jgi:hypothetical protein
VVDGGSYLVVKSLAPGLFHDVQVMAVPLRHVLCLMDAAHGTVRVLQLVPDTFYCSQCSSLDVLLRRTRCLSKERSA